MYESWKGFKQQRLHSRSRKVIVPFDDFLLVFHMSDITDFKNKLKAHLFKLVFDIQ